MGGSRSDWPDKQSSEAASGEAEARFLRRVHSDPSGLREYEAAARAFAVASDGELSAKALGHLSEIRDRWHLDEAECEGILARLRPSAPILEQRAITAPVSRYEPWPGMPDKPAIREFARLPGQGRSLRALSLSSNGLWLVVLSEDGRIVFWDTDRRDSAPIALKLGLFQKARALAMSPGGQMIYAGKSHVLVRASSGGATQDLDESVLGFSYEARDASGQLQHGSLTARSEREARLRLTEMRYDVLQISHAGKASPKQPDLEHLAASPDGRWLATARTGGRVEVYELSSGDVLWRFDSPDQRVWSITFSSDGKYLVFSGQQSSSMIRLSILSTDDWRFVQTDGVDCSPLRASGVAVGPDARVIAFGVQKVSRGMVFPLLDFAQHVREPKRVGVRESHAIHTGARFLLGGRLLVITTDRAFSLFLRLSDGEWTLRQQVDLDIGSQMVSRLAATDALVAFGLTDGGVRLWELYDAASKA